MTDGHALLNESVRRYPKRPALTQGERTLTYEDLAAAVDRLAARLGDLMPGQRVAIIAPNCVALPVALFAVWRVGAVPVPLSARYRESELGAILRDADVAVIVTVAAYRGYSFVAALSPLMPALPTLRRCLFVDEAGAGDEELAGLAGVATPSLDPSVGALLYSSGTTGVPTGALVSHAREVVSASSANAVLDCGAEDVAILVPPISHAFGLTCFLALIQAGSHCVLFDLPFSSVPIAAAVARYHATILHGSPTLFASLLTLSWQDWPTPRTGFVAGSACPAVLIERCDAHGFRLLNLYGSTELGMVSCCRRDDPAEVRALTVGRGLPGYTVRVADGEVQVRCAQAAPAYYRRPERMVSSFADGWFRTGDLGTLDSAGCLRISGRNTEVIHVAGFNVFPAEIEGLLLSHPDVDQVVVVGVPHPLLGEVPQAFVVPREGAHVSSSDLLRYSRARLAGYKLPYTIRIESTLPVLASGKPDRRSLARRAEEAPHGH